MKGGSRNCPFWLFGHAVCWMSEGTLILAFPRLGYHQVVSSELLRWKHVFEMLNAKTFASVHCEDEDQPTKGFCCASILYNKSSLVVTDADGKTNQIRIMRILLCEVL